MSDKARLNELISLYYNGTASNEQQKELFLLMEAGVLKEDVDPVMRSLWQKAVPDPETSASMSVALADEIWSRDNEQIGSLDTQVVVHRVHFLRTGWFRAAVAILLIAGIGAYLWLKPSTDKPSIAKTESVPAKNDVAPGGNKAILKLADGSEIILNDAANGKLANDGGAIIQKSADGEIRYSASQQQSTEVVFNSMSTPRGGQYQLVLPDGSKVWLNAESSITFPTRFTGAQREVELSGEGYFEVAKNAKQPFIVKTNANRIEVLGTAFNVNTYEDEKAMKASLVEGSIKVDNKILKPGQAYNNGYITDTDISQDIAWKSGIFNFNKMPLRQAMRQVARWYDVQVVYESGEPDITFGGKLKRNLNLSEILEGFAAMGIKYRLESGRKLVILL